MQETLVQFLGQEDPLEKGKVTHFSILAWRIPWTTVHEVAKSRTRLSNFHFPKPLKHEEAKQSRHVLTQAHLTKRETDP